MTDNTATLPRLEDIPTEEGTRILVYGQAHDKYDTLTPPEWYTVFRDDECWWTGYDSRNCCTQVDNITAWMQTPPIPT